MIRKLAFAITVALVIGGLTGTALAKPSVQTGATQALTFIRTGGDWKRSGRWV